MKQGLDRISRGTHHHEMIDIKSAELIQSDSVIGDMKKAVGNDLTLEIYISPGGEPHRAWDDEVKKNVKTRTKQSSPWQYDVIRSAIARVNTELGIIINEVFTEKESDTQIKLTTVPSSDVGNGEWMRSWDSSGMTDIYLSMTSNDSCVTSTGVELVSRKPARLGFLPLLSFRFVGY